MEGSARRLVTPPIREKRRPQMQTGTTNETETTSSDDNKQHNSNQIIENFDITSPEFRHMNGYRQQSGDTSSFSTLSTGTARSFEPFAVVNSHTNVLPEKVNSTIDDGSIASGAEPRESSAPAPTVTLQIDDESASDKIFRRRRLKFVQAMDQALRSSQEARNTIQAIIGPAMKLPTVSEVRSYPRTTDSPINLITDRIDGTRRVIGDSENMQRIDEEDKIVQEDVSIHNPIITSPTVSNSSRRRKATGGSQTVEDEELKSQTIFRMKRKSFQPPTSKSIDARNASSGSSINKSSTSSLTSRSSNLEKSALNKSKTMPQKSVTFQDSMRSLRSKSPGIVHELTGNITKVDPTEQNAPPSLVQHLTGNITKVEPGGSSQNERESNVNNDRIPMPGTAQHVQGEDRSKFLEFNSAINKEGTKSNRSLGLGQSSRRNLPMGTPSQYTRRAFNFRRFDTPSSSNLSEATSTGNDNGSNDPGSLTSAHTDSTNGNNESSQQTDEVSMVESNTNRSTSTRSWPSGHVFAVATPVPPQQNENNDSTTPRTNFRRGRKLSPFNDRRVIAVLGCLLIIIAYLSFAYALERQKNSETPIIESPSVQSSNPVINATTLVPPPLPFFDTENDFKNLTSAFLLSHDDEVYFTDGCMFNVDVKGDTPILPRFKLASIDMLLKESKQIPIQVWVKEGRYNGFEDIGSEWVNVFGPVDPNNRVFVDGNGFNKFTHIEGKFFTGAQATTFYLWEGRTFAVYVTATDTANTLDPMIVKGGIEEEKPFMGNDIMNITDGICFPYPFNNNVDNFEPMRWIGGLQFEEVTIQGLQDFADISSSIFPLFRKFP